MGVGNKLWAGGWVLSLLLALTGYNSGSQSQESVNETPGESAAALLEAGPNEALLYYKRPDSNYQGWGLHLWNDAASGCDGLAEGAPTTWDSPRLADGSYASDAKGVTRIREFRDMIMAISGLGLNVVMDVVYNHTNGAGMADISGFRFDLMGHHMLSNMTRALSAVQAIDPDTYFYGEGWNFGEVANNARGG